MKCFNKLFVANKTWALPEGHDKYSRVTEVHQTGLWIKLEGYVGSFQRGHIVKFSNKKAAPKVNRVVS